MSKVSTSYSNGTLGRKRLAFELLGKDLVGLERETRTLARRAHKKVDHGAVISFASAPLSRHGSACAARRASALRRARRGAGGALEPQAPAGPAARARPLPSQPQPQARGSGVTATSASSLRAASSRAARALSEPSRAAPPRSHLPWLPASPRAREQSESFRRLLLLAQARAKWRARARGLQRPQGFFLAAARPGPALAGKRAGGFGQGRRGRAREQESLEALLLVSSWLHQLSFPQPVSLAEMGHPCRPADCRP